VDRGDGGQPQKREQVTINPKSMEVTRREPFAAMTRGQQWRSWARFSHTGEAGGWWGETLAFITACGPSRSRSLALLSRTIACNAGGV
jgi:uncharacterized iron-regulated membrane protein